MTWLPDRARRQQTKGTRRGPRRGRGQRSKNRKLVLKRKGLKRPKRQGNELLCLDAEQLPPPKLPGTTRDWERLLMGIPGYDPFREAGDCWFDREAALDVFDFFHTELRHFKGENSAGRFFYLERWQQSVLGNLFGWKRPDGTRRYRYCFLLVGRKNGKTPLAAGICMYLLYRDGEPGAEVYCAARQYQQASKCFEYAYGMVVQNAALLTKTKVYIGNARCLQLGPETGGSFFRPIASDAASAYGFNTSGAVIDELFTQDDSRLVDALETSTANRTQPLFVYITTADFERDSICNDKHDYAISIRDHGGDPYFLPVLYAADPKDEVTKVSVWRKANPNLDVSVTREYLRQHARRAEQDAAYCNVFRRVHLCIRTQASEMALPAENWAKCGERVVDPEELKGRECWGGLDLASTSHSNALVLLFRDRLKDPELELQKEERNESERPIVSHSYAALAWFWIPQKTINDWEIKGKARYRLWAQQGLIRAIPGNTTDFRYIRRDINDLASHYQIMELAVDRLFQGQQLCTDLQDDGFSVIAFGQGFYSMAGPTKSFRDLVLDGRFHHGHNPVLDYHAANMSVAIDPAGNMKPDRQARHAPIDGIVSAIMALGRAELAESSGGGITIRVI